MPVPTYITLLCLGSTYFEKAPQPHLVPVVRSCGLLYGEKMGAVWVRLASANWALFRKSTPTHIFSPFSKTDTKFVEFPSALKTVGRRTFLL